jgi:hypothetical protein
LGTLLRRLLVLLALMFWQGGFTFYAAVVVPLGQEQLGHRRQGFITAEVTTYLNLSGAVALALLAWDLAVLRDRSALRRCLLWLSWSGMLVTQGLLFRLHPMLADQLVREGHLLSDPAFFRPWHRVYLWISTVQWGCGLAYAVLTLWAWRMEDQVPEPPSAASANGTAPQSIATGELTPVPDRAESVH